MKTNLSFKKVPTVKKRLETMEKVITKKVFRMKLRFWTLIS